MLVLTALVNLALATFTSAAFAHPGIYHNATNLAEIKVKSISSNEVWKAAYAVFRDDSFTSSSYTMRGPDALLNASSDATADPGTWHLLNDCKAAYQNALAWTITGDQAHATKAAEILDAWASTLKTVDNVENSLLRVAIDTSFLLNAAELLVHTGSGWKGSAAFGAWVKTVMLPVIETTLHSYNWGQAQAKTFMAAGIFFDNATMYNDALGLITGAKPINNTECKGLCCVGIEQAIDPAHGQVAESGRDQGHTQLELSHLSESCQIARSQGDGGACFDQSNSRLSKGFEFTAVVLNGGTIAWNADAFPDCKDIWWSRSVINIDSRATRPIFELPYAYYNGVRHASINNIAKAVARIRPEGQLEAKAAVADSIGFGTLLWAYS